MQTNNRRWFTLFLFCAGITVAAAFICQWLAGDFWVDNERFTILQLELFYSKYQLATTLAALKKPQNVAAGLALNYQLIFDFAFMAGVYPAISCICMMVREKIQRKGFRDLLFALAILQPLAWAFDVTENIFLMGWMDKPQIGDEFSNYHKIVIFKWLIALMGVLVAIVLFLFRKRPLFLQRN